MAPRGRLLKVLLHGWNILLLVAEFICSLLPNKIWYILVKSAKFVTALVRKIREQRAEKKKAELPAE